MTQPSRVIYLPPGVVPAPTGQTGVTPSGIPFDRTFFEQVLPGSIAAFAKQITCHQPIVQLLTVDGATHYVKGVAGLSESWVALHTQTEDPDRTAEVFVPFTTVFRLAIHACDEHNRRLGFILDRQQAPESG